MPKPNQAQQVACRAYANGDYSHLANDKDWREKIETCGDTLFKFLMIELSDDEDCADIEIAAGRIDRAIDELADVRVAIARVMNSN